MCYTCDCLLRDEHSRASLVLAKKYPCPKCKVFSASGDVPPARGTNPRRLKPCYHCWSKKSLHAECPVCTIASVQ